MTTPPPKRTLPQTTPSEWSPTPRQSPKKKKSRLSNACRQAIEDAVASKDPGASASAIDPPAQRPAFAPVFMSTEQRAIVQKVNKGQSVFFTGSAGTGKSVLLKMIIKELNQKFSENPLELAVTASTGMAACQVGGTTLHRFAGIGLGQEEPEELALQIKRRYTAHQRWLRVKALVIDEGQYAIPLQVRI